GTVSIHIEVVGASFGPVASRGGSPFHEALIGGRLDDSRCGNLPRSAGPRAWRLAVARRPEGTIVRRHDSHYGRRRGQPGRSAPAGREPGRRAGTREGRR